MIILPVELPGASTNTQGPRTQRSVSHTPPLFPHPSHYTYHTSPPSQSVFLFRDLTRMKWLVVCILAVVLVLYLAAGAYLFKYLEGTISNPEARNYTAEIANFSKSLAGRCYHNKKGAACMEKYNHMAIDL